jgi:hypothetical protein
MNDDLKGNCYDVIEVLSRHMPGETVESHGKFWSGVPADILTEHHKNTNLGPES